MQEENKYYSKTLQFIFQKQYNLIVNIFYNCLFVLLIIFSVSCKKDQEIQAIKKINSTDISYGADEFQRLDISLPAYRNKDTPVIFFVHGGGWTGGDKKSFEWLVEPLVSQGFAVVSINYRLAGGVVNYQHQNEDISEAIHYIKKRHLEYYISPDKFVLIGYSAGAHLSLLHTYKNDSEKLIKAVVSIAGPSNFCNPFYSQGIITHGIVAYNGTDFSSDPLIWKLNSPYYYVSKNAAPTYSLHGTSDDYVDINDSRNLHEKLDSCGVKNILLEKDADHINVFYLDSGQIQDIGKWIKTIIK